MNANAPPIAADGDLADRSVAICDMAEILPAGIDHDLIGGNRRGIGVHRRFQRLLTA
ncbi:MAG: hypothetical protein KF738_10220 [Burkholderiales bacterium]|nr:hypothetical protein [Burkholderiales bacterium]